MLVDSNIIIYAAKPEHQALRRFIARHAPAVSLSATSKSLAITDSPSGISETSRISVIAAPVLPISIDVLERATWLRQQRPIKLGDALIAGTALVHQLQLLTANTDDFEWISGLRISNPVG